MTLRLNNNNNNFASIDYVADVETNSTITIPEGDGTIAMVGAAGGLAGNISQATSLRLNDNFTNDDEVITGWQVPDTAAQVGGVGTQVTEADGVFTLPSTGIWLVVFMGRAIAAGGDTTIDVFTQMTQNGGTNWETIAQAGGGASGDDNATCSMVSLTICDITNTANDQFRFRTNSFETGSQLLGENNADNTRTSVLFLRLGDT